MAFTRQAVSAGERPLENAFGEGRSLTAPSSVRTADRRSLASRTMGDETIRDDREEERLRPQVLVSEVDHHAILAEFLHHRP